MKDNTNQISNKKSSKILVAVLLSIGVFVLIGIAGISAYLIGKNICQKCSSEDTSTTDISQSEDEENTDDSQTITTSNLDEITIQDTHNEEVYNDWVTYKDKDDRISFKYPKSWDIFISGYNPLGYTITISSGSGYSIQFNADEGNYGHYCIYSDSDTANMPEDYEFGIISVSKFNSYKEFSYNGKQYRISPSENKEQEYSICIYDKESSQFKSYLPHIGLVTYNTPSNPLLKDAENFEILNLILFSAK